MSSVQSPMKIALTDDEDKLLSGIELEALALKDHIHAHKNADAVVALMNALIERKAIPAIRTAWFSDPALNAGGRGRSIHDLFKGNGVRTADDLFRNTHFLAHARYFIYGPKLPASVIEALRAEVAERGMITSGDAVPLAKSAKAIARQHGLGKREADEFYKLALELGLEMSYAALIRDNVKKLS